MLLISIVIYAIVIWVTCSGDTFNELQKIHERASLLIYNIPDGKYPLSSVNWNAISYSCKRRLSLVMHDIIYENASKELTEMFQKQFIERLK